MSTASDIVGTAVSSATPWGRIIGLIGGVASRHYAPSLRAAGKRWLGRKLFQNISS